MVKTQPFVFWWFPPISHFNIKHIKSHHFPLETKLSHLFLYIPYTWSVRADQLNLIFQPISFLKCFSSLVLSKIMNSPSWKNQFFLNFHSRSGYASIPRASRDAARRTTCTLIRLRHKTDLCACLMLVILETLLGFPIKSSCCWHAVAIGLNTQGDRAACWAKSCAVWHSMWSFG